MVNALGCFLFYGIVPPREPGDVSPNDIAIALGWVQRDPVSGDAVMEDGREYDVWVDEQKYLTPQGLELDMLYCDGYPLAHIMAEGTVLYCDEEYPLAFCQLPSYTEEQRVFLEVLAQELGYDSPRWHLGTTPIE